MVKHHKHYSVNNHNIQTLFVWIVAKLNPLIELEQKTLLFVGIYSDQVPYSLLSANGTLILCLSQSS